MTNRTIKNLYPSDWIEYKFDDLFEFEGGMSLSRAKLSDEGICYLHYGDIHKSNVNYIDVDNKLEEIPKYNTTLDNIKDKHLLRNGDIVFADASEDYESIGKSIVVINKSNTPFISGLHTITAKDKTDLLDNTYKRYFLLDWNIRKQIMVLSTGISVLGINKGNLKTVRVLLPPLKEQSKIGRILSTWDKAIELKEKLIEQKKEQKKGLMQKLLTGEVRLPGFEGKWKKVKLKEISVCLDNLRRPINSKEREKMKGNIPYYGANGIVDYVNDYLFDEPLILMAEDGGHFNEFRDRPIAMKIEGKAWVNNHAHVLRIINSDYDFVYYSLVHKDIRKYINGSTRGKLTQSDMLAIELILPDSIEEQKAISHILMKIDLNIELLERELKELKCQKKGLMQLLLTGKVRVKV